MTAGNPGGFLIFSYFIFQKQNSDNSLKLISWRTGIKGILPCCEYLLTITVWQQEQERKSRKSPYIQNTKKTGVA
jgi:hypothetical protein